MIPTDYLGAKKIKPISIQIPSPSIVWRSKRIVEIYVGVCSALYGLGDYRNGMEWNGWNDCLAPAPKFVLILSLAETSSISSSPVSHRILSLSSGRITKLHISTGTPNKAENRRKKTKEEGKNTPGILK